MRTHQIAHELGLSPRTVDTYIASAFRKLGVGDRDTAARLLVEHERASGKTPSDFSEIDATASTVLSSRSRFPFPWPTKGRPHNDLTTWQLAVAIVVATTILLAVAAIYLLALVALGDRV